MQAAIYQTEWVHDETKPTKPLAGLLLGYSTLGLHLRGVTPLMAQLGVSTKATCVLDSQVSRAPAELRLQEFSLPRIDRRRKEHKALLLTMANAERMRMLPADPVERARNMGTLCTVLPSMGKKTEQLLTSWDEGSFSVCAVGEENIANLRELYNAFTRKDISLVHPYVRGLVQGGLGFCIFSRLPKELHAQIEELNASNKHSRVAFEQSNIVAHLAAVGHRFADIQPQWDTDNNQLMLFFKPLKDEFDKYCTGWFSLQEVEQLVMMKGPLLKPLPKVYAELRALGESMCKRMEEEGVKFAFAPQFFFKDNAAHVSLYLSEPHLASGLTTGQYPLRHITATMATVEASTEAATVELERIARQNGAYAELALS